MARLNTRATTPKPRKAGTSPLGTKQKPNATTHEGATAYNYKDKTALFLAATASFITEPQFYEGADERVQRYVELVRKVAAKDPQWFVGFVGWLRLGGNMRTASVVAAAEGADALIKAGKPELVAQLVDVALQRADEPGEFMAYWRSKIRRHFAPRAVKRGIGRAVNRLYNQYTLLKYDTPAYGYRFGDVIDQAHPDPALAWHPDEQNALYKHALDRRRHNDEPPVELEMVHAAWKINRLSDKGKRSLLLSEGGRAQLKAAGMTWEDISGFGAMDKVAWEAAIPQMAYGALLKNLRNFEQVGVSRDRQEWVVSILADPEKVARSRQLPYRFLTAYLETQGSAWGPALEAALSASTRNIPELDGLTVVLVDTSDSMNNPLSKRSKVSRMKAGALFGVALAAKNASAKLYGFADGVNVFEHSVVRGANVLRVTEQFVRRCGEDGHGTNIGGALRHAVQKHPDAARIVLISDMQTWGGGNSYEANVQYWNRLYGYTSPEGAVPDHIPVYAFNLAGYEATPIPSDTNRYQLGGLTDATFALIKAIEDGKAARWPWETEPAVAEAA